MDLIDKLKRADKMLHREDKPLLIHWFSEIYYEVSSTSFTYQVGYKLSSMQVHIQTYRNYAENCISKALAALQEVMSELRSRHTNFNRVSQIITALIATNFYSTNAQRKLA